MGELGFDILPGEHPIVPVMVGDEVKAARLSEQLVELGVYAVSFSYPVVPRGTARDPHADVGRALHRGRRMRRGAVRGGPRRAGGLRPGFQTIARAR